MIFAITMIVLDGVYTIDAAFGMQQQVHHHHHHPAKIFRTMKHQQCSIRVLKNPSVVRSSYQYSTSSSSSATTTTTTTTALSMFVDVPDGFFTVTFFGAGLVLSVSRALVRVGLEERAWEQRLAEGRNEFLRRHPDYTELDLRRREAAMEWSAYGTPPPSKQQQQQQSRKRKRTTAVLDREEDSQRPNTTISGSRMTPEEIEAFELEYGITYDPYYDEPYDVSELPSGKYSVDKLYGDRIYENGEIFYRDGDMYWRQGSKPRNVRFF